MSLSNKILTSIAIALVPVAMYFVSPAIQNYVIGIVAFAAILLIISIISSKHHGE